MRKYTIEYIKKCFECEDYVLLSTEYVGCKQKLGYICPNGHKHSITFTKWLSGQRCYYCKGNVKLTTEFVKGAFEKEGYELLSFYENSNTKLKYKCPKDHYGCIKWDHWRDGHRCAECAGNKKKDINIIRKEFAKENYTLLSDNYISSSAELKYRCPNGHVGTITYYNWVTGYRCLECSGCKKKTIEEVKKSVEDEGYKLITTNYINCDQKLHLVCPNGHDYYVTWDNWNHSGSRCVKCKGWGTSYQESMLFEFLHTLCPNIIEHDRNIISPHELDVVIPNKKMAVEYCGLYWHSELMGKDNKYHLNKLISCEKNNYKLITIFEDEFVNNKDIVFSRLRNILNSGDLEIVYARNCIIKEISIKQAKLFCNNNHLQGYHGSVVKLGAFYNGELVSVMTFAKPSIAKGSGVYKEGVWELSRFCSKLDYLVVGIASKLLKYFERNYKWNKIFSYADRRWSNGNLYEKIGFKFVGVTSPNYWYLKGQKRIHRFALRKTKEDPKDQTEWQIRKSQGWNKIWDCGNLKYEKLYNASNFKRLSLGKGQGV